MNMNSEHLGGITHHHPAIFIAGAIPVALLLGFVVLAAWGRRMRCGGGVAATLLSAGAFAGAVSVVVILQRNHGGGTAPALWFDWLQLGGKSIAMGIALGTHSPPMLLLITFITTLVHVFSLAYMERDPMRHRYWAYLALFSAAMCGLVLADDLLLMFVCWELVGLASWLLIGFWFREEVAAMASQKAFIVNRIADAGFVMALMMVWAKHGHFQIPSGLESIVQNPRFDLWIGLGLLVGAMGKSAQFPFQTWLPDAMAGPMPVSSLIHAATMVAAGVYLLVRTAPFFPEGLRVAMAMVGAFTALMAALSALAQTDIKRVLAYSTVSQLGLMILAVGAGRPSAAFAHLWAHAFFKCGLFLAAGAVIHRLHAAQEGQGTHFDAQDMRRMGGLRRKMPVVFVTWLFFAASLAGLPFFSGFLSKDAILHHAILFAQRGPAWYHAVPVAALVTSMLTAFYIARQGMLVFLGTNRADGAGAAAKFSDSISKPGLRMVLPLCLLALGSTWLVFLLPLSFHAAFDRGIAEPPGIFPLVPMSLSVLAIGLAFVLHRRDLLAFRPHGLLHELSFRHFFIDDVLRWLAANVIGRLSDFLGLWDKHVVDGAVRRMAGMILRNEGVRATEPLGVAQAPPGDGPPERPLPPTGRLSLSSASAWLDQRLIDRMVNGFAAGIMRMGKRVGALQTGKLQRYILYTMAGLLLLLAMIVIFAR
ncbi:MAG: NADH-quinone oxidoreductase subunit [Bacteroidota bacterium]|jgi:NADH-quinone oxidoreductase subunit L